MLLALASVGEKLASRERITVYYYPIFADTQTNLRRWHYCLAAMVEQLIGVWCVITFAPPPESGSRGWGPALGYALLATLGILVYWVLLLVKLCASLKLNTAGWVFFICRLSFD